MRNNLIILITIFLLSSCKNSTQEKKILTQEISNISENQKIEKNSKEYKIENKEQQTDCDKYWERRFPDDSLKTKYINEIISNNSLTENNINFLNALKPENEDKLAFKKVLSPIFRLSNSEIGILSFPKYKQVGNRFVQFSKEMDLIEKYGRKEYDMDNFGKIKFYPMILDSVYEQKSKPIINYYAVNKIGSTQIKDLGEYYSECLEYYEYSIETTNISINDKLLFSSPFEIDLIFENNHKVDSLLENDYKKECYDCPNSTKLQKTFARLKGTNNLYFVYADTFPINNELDTPSRALILINKENEIVYLWYDEIDLFGCSCL